MDVVYPYKHPGHSEELRYSVRSIAQHFPEHGTLWIIGERPDGLDPQTYRFIPHDSAPRHDAAWLSAPWPDLARLRAKERNINEKLAIIAHHEAISEHFLFINDDHYLLQDTTAEQLQQTVYTRGSARSTDYVPRLMQHYPGKAPYKVLIQETLAEVMRHGLAGLDFEAHVPAVLSRARCRELIARYQTGNRMFHWTWLSLYFNTFPPEHPVMIWLSHAQKMYADPTGPTHKLEVRGRPHRYWIEAQITADTRFLNHNWSGFKRAYIDLLQDRFPTPCRYEHTEADALPPEPTLPVVRGAAHLFWTGGIDSTFRLLQLLSDGVSVVPIYIAARIDSRTNQDQEQATMVRLTAVIRERFQDATLHDLQIIEVLPDNAWVDAQAQCIGHGSSHGMRMGTQYVGLCRFAESHHEPIEIGVEIGGRAERMLRGRVRGRGGDCRIDPSTLASGIERALMIFHRLRFPLLHLDRPAMLAEARQRGFLDLLEQTWSCWFPQDGQPCERCWMCHGRAKGLG